MEGSSQNTESITVEQLDPLADYYPMTKKILGNVYIFNHVTFNNRTLGPRYGGIRDSKDIEEVFKGLNFKVKIYNDLSYKKILQKLSKIANINYSDFDCLIIFVLTHGRNGKIFANDIDYYPDVYWNSFNNKSSFMHKPKLIFIQDSRGDEADDETHYGKIMPPIVKTDALIPTSYTIPDVPDVLLMYSCYDGYFSWRSSISGSSFAQRFCKEFKLRAKNTDLLTLLTLLNRIMSVNYSWDGNMGNSNERRHNTIVSTLTKVMSFEDINK